MYMPPALIIKRQFQVPSVNSIDNFFLSNFYFYQLKTNLFLQYISSLLEEKFYSLYLGLSADRHMVNKSDVNRAEVEVLAFVGCI